MKKLLLGATLCLTACSTLTTPVTTVPVATPTPIVTKPVPTASPIATPSPSPSPAPVTQLPPKVLGITVTATPVSSTEIDLSWNDPSNGLAGFVVSRRPTNGDPTIYPMTVIATLAPGVTSYKDVDLTPTWQYNYLILMTYSTTTNAQTTAQ